jgi:hypothetical protein
MTEDLPEPPAQPGLTPDLIWQLATSFMATRYLIAEQDGRLFALTVLGERLRAEVLGRVRLWALLVESLETALGFEPLTELRRQMIEACVPERDLGAESCDHRRSRQAIGRTMLPAPRYPALLSL